MKKILRDPLVHFIALGFLLFFGYSLVGDTPASRDSIIIDSRDIESMTGKWEMQWNRPPTQEELCNLVLQNIKQEVFYQEALKMNLDHNDEIIKRRLSQKMEFLSNDLATLSEPSDEELKAYFNSQAEKYMLPYAYELYQVVFTNDKHDNADVAFKNALEASKNLSLDEMGSKGDRLPFPYHYANTNARELAGQLGSVFADNLETLELNRWLGPVESGFGKHLVYIIEREDPKLPELTSIKDLVLRDFQYQKQKEVNNLIFHTLKDKYELEFNFEDSEGSDEFESVIRQKLTN